ncbi:hypothetical protein D3C86_1898730 [compost metagenome]
MQPAAFKQSRSSAKNIIHIAFNAALVIILFPLPRIQSILVTQQVYTPEYGIACIYKSSHRLTGAGTGGIPDGQILSREMLSKYIQGAGFERAKRLSVRT